MNQLILRFLAGMFIGRMGRPLTIDWGGEEATIDFWERIYGSEAKAYKEEDE